MLQPPDRRDTLSLHRSVPLQVKKVEYQQIVQPVLSVTSAEDKHHVLDHARGVKLAHWCLASDYAGDVKLKFIDALFQVDKDHIGKNLKAVPTPVNDDLRAIPELA